MQTRLLCYTEVSTVLHPPLLQINIPAPVGMICVGLFLRNVAGAVLITGLKPSWSKEIRAAALAMIFLRSGLELNLSVQPLTTKCGPPSGQQEHSLFMGLRGPRGIFSARMGP